VWLLVNKCSKHDLWKWNSNMTMILKIIICHWKRPSMLMSMIRTSLCRLVHIYLFVRNIFSWFFLLIFNIPYMPFQKLFLGWFSPVMEIWLLIKRCIPQKKKKKKRQTIFFFFAEIWVIKFSRYLIGPNLTPVQIPPPTIFWIPLVSLPFTK